MARLQARGGRDEADGNGRRDREHRVDQRRGGNAVQLPLCPGIIATEIVAPVQEADPAAYQRLLDGIPMGRLGDADDIAHAAVYLASDEARYVTGAEIRVDGGYTAQ
jgi:hypothetical protein